MAQGIVLDWRPVDDAYISLRYAANWANGHGLVFNPGDYVEGYSNFLWVALLAGAARGGLDLVAASIGLGVAFTALSLWLTLTLARRVGAERNWSAGAAWVPAILLAFYPGSAYWALGGMEGPMLTALMLAFLVVGLRAIASLPHLLLVGLVGALTAMTRWESVLAWPVVLAFSLLDSSRPMRRRAARCALLAGVMVAIFAGYFLWRVEYYGEWLPNTYHAKVGGGLAGRLGGGIAYSLEFAVTWLLPVTLVLWALRPGGRVSACLLALLLAYCAYVTWTGGDHFCWLRFYLPVLPIAAILAAELPQRLARGFEGSARVRWAGPLVSVAMVAVIAGFAWRIDLLAARQHRRVVRDWCTVGAWARTHVPRHYRIALAPVGAAAYYWGGPVLDLLGLTDRETAHFGELDPSEAPGHQKSHLAYVLRRQPEIVLGQALLYAAPPGADQAIDESMRKALIRLYRMPAFQELYRYRVAPVGGRHLPCWIRRDLPEATMEQPLEGVVPSPPAASLP